MRLKIDYSASMMDLLFGIIASVIVGHNYATWAGWALFCVLCVLSPRRWKETD